MESLLTLHGLTWIQRVMRSYGGVVLTIYHAFNGQSTGVQKRYCLIHSNEIPWLLLLRMNYVCVTVLICDRHRLSGNVGHILMHNNSFLLDSHQQVGRLSPVFFRVFSSSCAYFMQLLSGNQVHIPLPQVAVDIQSCCPSTFTNSCQRPESLRDTVAHNSIGRFFKISNRMI